LPAQAAQENFVGINCRLCNVLLHRIHVEPQQSLKSWNVESTWSHNKAWNHMECGIRQREWKIV
jgi:hypothetical protein